MKKTSHPSPEPLLSKLKSILSLKLSLKLKKDELNVGWVIQQILSRLTAGKGSIGSSIRQANFGFSLFALILLMAALGMIVAGCHSNSAQKQNRDFFTSGSREADQRASQRMAKDEQLAGSGEGAGEKGVQKAVVGTNRDSKSGITNKAALAEAKLTLFDRLGGEQGITAIVDDFMPRALEDPRVNWPRKGVVRGGFSFHHNQSVTWADTDPAVAQLKKHMVQFLALATGGPAQYDGKEIKSAHANMHITNPEFDATVGDLKASLDRLKIPNTEQKELLAIVESTRPQIVTQR